MTSAIAAAAVDSPETDLCGKSPSPFDRPSHDRDSHDSRRTHSSASDRTDANANPSDPLLHLHLVKSAEPLLSVAENQPDAGSSASESPSVLLGRGAHGTVQLGTSSSVSSGSPNPSSNVSQPLDCAPREVAVKRVEAHASAECRAAAQAELAFVSRTEDVISPPLASNGPADGEAGVWRHIAEVLGAGIDPPSGQCTIVCEALRGGTVQAAIAAGALSEARSVRSVVRDMVAGLDVLHTDLRVLHNYLKLDNVMFSTAAPDEIAAQSPPRAKLIDFGCSSVLPLDSAPDATHPLPQRGALKAMSPERLRGESYGPAADVWSLGVCALELARGGRHPFLQPPRGAPAEGPSSTDTFWRLAAALKFVDGPVSCDVATRGAVAAAVADSCVADFATDPAFADFVGRALTADPASRATARELLQHPWLASE